MPVITTRTVALLLSAVAVSASAQKFEQVYNIPISANAKTIGQRPRTTLAVGPDGKLYGTTSEGGAQDVGTAFRVTTTGQAEWLGDFNPAITGGRPSTQMMNLDGKLYGITFSGGQTPNGSRYGSIYRLDPTNIADSPEGALTPFYQVASANGVYPARDFCVGEPGIFHLLGRDPAGIYRVTQNGAAGTVLYKFKTPFSVDGGFAESLIAGGDGFLYGVTSGSYTRASDNKSIYGTIFRIRVDGTEMTTLHEFIDVEGKWPGSRLLAAPDGYLYGTTNDGGNSSNRGNGTIFRIDRNGQNFKVIKDLDNTARYPSGELLLAPDGYLYGLAEGVSSYGHIYRLKLDGSGFKVMYNFKGSATDSGYPMGGLTLGPDGNLYGVTRQESGTSGGSVFRLVTKFAAPPANRPPVAMDDLVAGVSFAGGAKAIAVKANDYDPDGDALVLSITEQPEFGTLKALPGGALLYTPDADFTTGDSFSYKISDGRSGESEATVYLTSGEATPLLVAGLYTGLVREQTEEPSPNSDLPRGLVRVQLAATGKFTGSLQTQGKKVTLTGKVSEAGTIALPLSLPDKTKAVLYLALQRGDVPSIYAVLYGPQLCTGLAAQAVPFQLSVKKHLATAFSLTASPISVGHGHAVGSITDTGIVTLAGKLGDGTKLSVSSNFTRTPDGRTILPVFAEPMAKGLWGGDLEFDSGAAIHGETRWERPPALKLGQPYQSGFSVVSETSIEPFTAPTSKEPIMNRPTGLVTLAGTPLTSSVTGKFTLNVSKLTLTLPMKSFTLTRTSGAFSGSMMVNGKAVAFTGSVLQDDGIGYGQFLLNGVAGTVEIAPDLSFDTSAPAAP